VLAKHRDPDRLSGTGENTYEAGQSDDPPAVETAR